MALYKFRIIIIIILMYKTAVYTPVNGGIPQHYYIAQVSINVLLSNITFF